MPRTQLQQLEQSVEDLEQRLRGLEVEDRSKFRFITKELIGFLGLSATLLSAFKFSKPQNSLQQNLVCSEVEPSKIRECGLLSNYNYTDFLGHKEETRTQLFYMKSFAQNKQQATQIIDKANNGEKVRITSLEIAKEILGQCNENLLRKIVMQVAGDDNSLQLLRTAVKDAALGNVLTPAELTSLVPSTDAVALQAIVARNINDAALTTAILARDAVLVAAGGAGLNAGDLTSLIPSADAAALQAIVAIIQARPINDAALNAAVLAQNAALVAAGNVGLTPAQLAIVETPLQRIERELGELMAARAEPARIIEKLGEQPVLISQLSPKNQQDIAHYAVQKDEIAKQITDPTAKRLMYAEVYGNL